MNKTMGRIGPWRVTRQSEEQKDMTLYNPCPLSYIALKATFNSSFTAVGSLIHCIIDVKAVVYIFRILQNYLE